MRSAGSAWTSRRRRWPRPWARRSRTRLGPPRAADLSEHDRALLESSGLDLDARGAAARAAEESAAAFMALLGTGLTVAQASDRLGIDASRVRHRIGSRELYAVGMGARRRLPAFQFDEDASLPGLGEVVRALPHDAHPLEVEGFFTSPQSELELGGVALTPRAWLAAGGDPRAVVALAEPLGRPDGTGMARLLDCDARRRPVAPAPDLRSGRRPVECAPPSRRRVPRGSRGTCHQAPRC